MECLHKMIQVIIFKSSNLFCSCMKDNIKITALKEKRKCTVAKRCILYSLVYVTIYQQSMDLYNCDVCQLDTRHLHSLPLWVYYCTQVTIDDE